MPASSVLTHPRQLYSTISSAFEKSEGLSSAWNNILDRIAGDSELQQLLGIQHAAALACIAQTKLTSGYDFAGGKRVLLIQVDDPIAHYWLENQFKGKLEDWLSSLTASQEWLVYFYTDVPPDLDSIGVFDLSTDSAEPEGRTENGPAHEEESLDAIQPPEEIWRLAIEQIRLQMSEADYRRFLSGAGFVSYKDNLFTVSVPDPYSRDWLESRLTTSFERILKSFCWRPTRVRFVVQEAAQTPIEALPDSAVSSQEGETEEEGDLVLLEEINQSIYRGLVDKQAVYFPSYLLRWVPVVGARMVLTWIACLEAYYLKIKTQFSPKGKNQFQARADEIWKWGLSRATFFRSLDEPEMQWFIRKLEKTQGKTNKHGRIIDEVNTYQFVAYNPLTPPDASDLRQFLLSLDIRTDPLGALERAIGTKRSNILPVFPRGLSAEQKMMHPQVFTVQSVVESAYGKPLTSLDANSYQSFMNKVSELEDLIWGGDVKASWYFLQEILPRLDYNRAMLVLLMRRMGFQNDEETRAEIHIPDAKQTIADFLGVTTKTVTNIFAEADSARDSQAPAAEAQALFKQMVRIQEQGGERKQTWTLKTNFHDPLTEPDQRLHDALTNVIWKTVRMVQEGSLNAEQLSRQLNEIADQSALLRNGRKQSNSSSAQASAAKVEILRLHEEDTLEKLRLHTDEWEILRLQYHAGLENLRRHISPEQEILGLLLEILRLDYSIEAEKLILQPVEKAENLRRLKILTLVLNTLTEILDKQPTSDEAGDELLKRWVVGNPAKTNLDFDQVIQNTVLSIQKRLEIRQLLRGRIAPLASWLIHAASPVRGKNVESIQSLAIARLIEVNGSGAGQPCDQLAQLTARELGNLLVAQLNQDRMGGSAVELSWKTIMQGADPVKLVALAQCLGLEIYRE